MIYAYITFLFNTAEILQLFDELRKTNRAAVTSVQYWV